MHNFDLLILLYVLDIFGGAYGAIAAFLARKQRIEAKIGLQVSMDDGKKHSMTLSRRQTQQHTRKPIAMPSQVI